jgi:hypothetical protein
MGREERFFVAALLRMTVLRRERKTGTAIKEANEDYTIKKRIGNDSSGGGAA